jgi:hypothetical protein
MGLRLGLHQDLRPSTHGSIAMVARKVPGPATARAPRACRLSGPDRCWRHAGLLRRGTPYDRRSAPGDAAGKNGVWQLELKHEGVDVA